MKRGYILVLATFIIASCILLISLVVNRVNAYRHMSVVWGDVQKARCLALGGIEIAMSQLQPLYAKKAAESEKKKEEGEAKPKKVSQEEKTAPARVLLDVLNTWQTFTLKEKSEGIDGECKLYISSEEGKINLNGLYDFKKRQLAESSKKIASFLTEGLRNTFERSRQKPVSFMRVFEGLFKNRSVPVNDATELVTVPVLHGVSETLFEAPDYKGIVITDLFTIFTPTATINPLLISKSLGQATGLAPSKNRDSKVLEELSSLIQSPNINWEDAWNKVLAKVYGKEYRALPETFKNVFSARFEANLFSVVSYGKVGSITQKVCAIIEKNRDLSESGPPFICKRLYWI